ncbi:MAG: UDP-N-acetylmuramoyl-tripeptide--D-alanyl-D-alanine ligase [Actinomycetaceae bacterium]|nr:UDP-N-acetylmuramoyl-tripeptide--D-alanyl-D-alanine ligase [Actinomycetaceae bacterium]
MMAITLADIASITGGHFAGSSEESGVAMPSAQSAVTQSAATGVVIDNRQITGGELFVAIAGERVDGNKFAANALERGAVGVLTSDRQAALDSGATPERVIVVADPVKALADLAREQVRRLRRTGNPDLRIVGVTGSVGKTSTKDLLGELLAYRGPITAPVGSFNNEIGFPLTVLRADEHTATLVLEMGADEVGNIEYLTDIATPDVSVVLIVARAHLGGFGGIDKVAIAKSELVRATRPGGVVVLNNDDQRVRAMASDASGEVVFFSASGANTSGVWASDTVLDDAGRASFVLHAGQESTRVHLKLVGAHHVTNALAATAVAHVFGRDLTAIAADLAVAGPVSPHRMDVVELGDIVMIDDSYNANPDSMRAGLDALAQIGRGRRKIAVLGAMRELGANSDAEHVAIGEYLAHVECDEAVCVGDGLEDLATSARKAGIKVHDARDIDSASAMLDAVLRPGDVVLLKGSYSTNIWQVANELKKRRGSC